MSMETFTKDNGKTTKQMDLEFTLIQMVLNIQDFGRMITKMVSAHRNGLMVVNIKEIIKMVKKMVKVIIYGQMVVIIEEIG